MKEKGGSSGRHSVEARFTLPSDGEEPSASAEEGGAPFRLLVLADFSGRGSRGVGEELATRRPRRVDRDDLEQVLAQLAPELRVGTRKAGVQLTLRPRSLDDLHPDALWQQLAVFGELRSLRRRLSDPATFAQAAAEIGRSVPAAPAPQPTAPRADVRAGPSGLLEAALSATESAAPTRTGSELVDALLAELVIPRIPATPGQTALLEALDAAVAEEMRALLRAPELRQLESAWRALELLVRRVETDALLQVWILDVTREELILDLAASEDPRATATWRALFEPDAAGESRRFAAWTALDLSFRAQATPLALLGRIGRLAEAARTPFLAAAHESLAGCASLADHPDPDEWEAPASAWKALRAESCAQWLLLALPRLLLRSPYGKRTGPLEHFVFEELSGAPRHEEFLWGSGAIAPTLALAEAFAGAGWSLDTRARWMIDRLPLPVYADADGESTIKPAAEIVLTDRAREHLESAGLLPLSTVRDTDRVHLGPLSSVAGTPLAGRWSREER